MEQPALPPPPPEPSRALAVYRPRPRRHRHRPSSLADKLKLAGAVALTLGGLTSIGMAAGLKFEAWNTQRTWSASPEARVAAQVLAAPTPIWLPDPAAPVTLVTDDPYSALAPPVVMLGPPSSVRFLDARFAFNDPPEPEAHARLTLSLQVGGDRPGPGLAVSIPSVWFEGYRIEATQPASTRDASADDGVHRLLLGGVGPGPASLTFDVVATGERVDPPTVRLERSDTGMLIAEAHPPTLAPRPRPGPVSAIHIPRLELSAAVVPTTWEPPAFVVGQVRGSSAVTQGNTILVGHLGGAAGDVFKNLDKLVPGDTVVAVSRGVEYNFMVSDKETRAADDSTPTWSGLSPRLTLMTCTGDWDPLSRNYSDRLWVTAELPTDAARTILANSTRPPTPVPVPRPSPTPADQHAAIERGLGAERASLDASLGPPLGETPDKKVVYRQGGAEYHVAFTPDPPRARLLEVLPLGQTVSLSIPTAVERAHTEFPPDATPSSQAPDGTPNLVVERWMSSALATTLATSGDFTATYARDSSGGVTRVVIAAEVP